MKKLYNAPELKITQLEQRCVLALSNPAKQDPFGDDLY